MSETSGYPDSFYAATAVGVRDYPGMVLVMLYYTIKDRL
jgi:hypothetical protein